MYDILELVSRSYFLISDKQGGQDVNDRQNVVSTFQCVQQSNNVAISLKLRGVLFRYHLGGGGNSMKFWNAKK